MANWSLYFTQEANKPDAEMVQFIGAERRSVSVAMFALTRQSFVDALVAAAARCPAGQVRLITDAREAVTAGQAAALATLQHAGVPIKINHHSGLMHLKMVVTSRGGVALGSWNASTAASTINDEILLVSTDRHLQSRCQHDFEIMWADTTRFADWSPAAARAIAAALPPMEF